MIEQYTVEDRKLSQNFSRNGSSIFSLKYDFERRSQCALILPKISKSEILTVYRSQIINNKKLLISAVEGNAKDLEGENTLEEINLLPGEAFSDCSVITDIRKFRRAVQFK